LSAGKTFILTNVNDFRGAARGLGIEIWLLMIAREPQMWKDISIATYIVSIHM